MTACRCPDGHDWIEVTTLADACPKLMCVWCGATKKGARFRTRPVQPEIGAGPNPLRVQ